MTQKLRHTMMIVCASLVCCLFFWGTGQLLFPGVSETAAVASEVEKDPYLLREFDGKIALFSTPYEAPNTVYPIYLNTLPELDRKRLSRGIYLPDEETVARYIADFES